MAVLKSFELKGNKQSFANWISNLSPADTPFVSMIGKEGIDQTQYSWQTDALSPPSSDTYEEGSLFVSQPRASTEVLTNFTSILRKVVQLSDTNEATRAWGRSNEMSYQMGKAGKELLRDLEFMNLSNVNGVPAEGKVPGKFAGFEGLTAKLNAVCPDTNAVVHKEIVVADGLFTAIDKDDLFDMTYNLYVSGSKADKIMFHPKHAPSFSALIAGNTQEPLTYRLFDGLSDKYNARVNKIRDPLGRTYTLIPNRFMPENKIYFFNESDWTQTILRAPRIVKLSKNGSTDRKMVEMEVGLRHKHPYASGILTLNSVVIQNGTFSSKDTLTAGVGDSGLVTAEITVNGSAEKDLLVTWHTSNVNIVDFQHPQQLTDASGRAVNYLRGGSETGVARIWSVCRGVKSAEYSVTCMNPKVELDVDDAAPSAGQDITLTATVKKHDNTAVGANVLVEWFHNPDFNFTFASETSKTDSQGIATVTATARNTNPTIVQALVNKVPSDKWIINYVPTSDVVEAPVITPDTFKGGESVTATVDVIDHEGNPLEGAMVSWNYYPYGLVALSETQTITDNNGTATVTLTGVGTGNGFLSGTCEGVTSDATPFFVGTGANMVFTTEPSTGIVGSELKFTVTLTGQDGSPLRDALVTFSETPAFAPALDDGQTDNNGVYEVTVTPVASYEGRVVARAQEFTESRAIDLVVE